MNKENRKLYRSLYFSSLSNQNLLELFHREKSSFFLLKVSGGTTIPESFSMHLEFKRLKCSWSGINRVKVCAYIKLSLKIPRLQLDYNKAVKKALKSVLNFVETNNGTWRRK